MYGLYVFEGADGTGKTTAINLIEEKISHLTDMKIIRLQEPHNSRDDIIRAGFDNWLKLFYFYVRDREETCRRIHEKEDEDVIFLQDRSYHSSCVYQGLQSGLSPEFIKNAHPCTITPHVTFVFQTSKDEAKRRLKKRLQQKSSTKEIDFFDKKWEFQEGVMNLYQNLINDDNAFEECIGVDAGRTPVEIAEECCSIILKDLSRKN